MSNLKQKFPWNLGVIQICLCGFMLLLPLTGQAVAQPSNRTNVQNRTTETWQDRFAQIFRRKPPLPQSTGVSRGQFCLLSPGLTFEQGQSDLWEQRPSFIWTGRIGKMQVKKAGSSEPLWQQSFPMGLPKSNALDLQGFRYNGPALEPGQRYEWLVFDRASDSSPQMFRTFSILPSDSRGPVTRAWLREQLTLIQKQTTLGEHTQWQLDFLLTENLPSDFYQALFLAALRGHLNEEREAIVAGVIKELCSE